MWQRVVQQHTLDQAAGGIAAIISDFRYFGEMVPQAIVCISFGTMHSQHHVFVVENDAERPDIFEKFVEELGNVAHPLEDIEERLAGAVQILLERGTERVIFPFGFHEKEWEPSLTASLARVQAIRELDGILEECGLDEGISMKRDGKVGFRLRDLAAILCRFDQMLLLKTPLFLTAERENTAKIEAVNHGDHDGSAEIGLTRGGALYLVPLKLLGRHWRKPPVLPHVRPPVTYIMPQCI